MDTYYIHFTEKRRNKNSPHLSIKAVKNRKEIVINNLCELPEFELLRKESPKTQSSRRFFNSVKSQIIFPILLNNECIGVTNIYSDKENFFTEEKVHLFQDINRIAAIAIENDKLSKIRIKTSEERQKRLKLIIELSAQFRVEQNLKDLLQIVVKKTSERIQAEVTNIYIFNSQEFLLKKEATFCEIGNLNFREAQSSGEGLTGITFQGRDNYVLINEEEEIFKRAMSHYYFEYKKRLHSKSIKHYLGIPLLGETGRPFGVLEVINKKDNSFTIESPLLDSSGFSEDDLELLQLIANFISIFISDIKKNNSFNSLSEIAKKIVSTFNRHEIIEKVCQSIINLDYDACIISIVEGNTIKYLGASGVSNNFKVKIGDKVDFRNCDKCVEYLCNEVNIEKSLEKGFRRCKDLSTLNCVHPSKNAALQDGFLSLLCLPLVLENKKIGCMEIYMRHSYDFTDYEVELLKGFSNQTAIAIQNCNLFDDLSKNIKLLEKLQSIGKAVSSVVDLKIILNTILEEITKSPFGFDYGTITLKIGDRIKTVAGKNVSEGWIKMSDYPQSSKDIQVDIIKKGETEILKGWDPRLNPRMFKKYKHDQLVRAYVPIKCQKEILGTLEVGYNSKKKSHISDKEIQLLEAFMDYAGIAIRNSRLVDTLNRKAKGLEGIEDIIGGTIASSDFKDILQTTIERAIELIGADAGVIALCEKTNSYLHPKVWKGYDREIPIVDFDIPEGITGLVAKTGKI